MPEHDFRDLYAQYPDIIAQIPEIFTSHQFILELARQNHMKFNHLKKWGKHKLPNCHFD